ncbi:kinesin-like protein KIF15 [Amphiura filiformis]|uniref:kinesin-like protein KIF15 n=1 Tax=Amphiura filiformis TaxID=82378 RepID=UPI003B21BC7E
MPSTEQHSVGDSGDAIKVYLRIRPPAEGDLDHNGQILDVKPPNAVLLKSTKKVYTFDHVADTQTTQEAVFAAVGKPTIESCVAGYNSTIFAYGQTGSGKTFTMLGPSEEGNNFEHELRGVIPRSFEYLFNLVNREREMQGDRFEFLCRVSFLEIYHEQVYDLLDQASTTGLQLRENIKKGVFVDGLIETVVNNAVEAYEVLSAGWVNRRVAATSMNRESSRSHAVFTVSIESKEKKAGVSNIRVSQLHLVDLAGSERQKDTKASGARLKEAGSINRSLSALGNVITALVDIEHGKSRYVPYRDSKLSFLLRDALGGNSKTFIIANVHPGSKCFGETLSTLNFARRAKMIKNKAVVNEDTQGNVAHLQAEIKRLKDQLVAYQSGSMPSEIQGAASTSTSCVPQKASEDGILWKHRFLDAMCLREKSDNEVKLMKEKCAELQDLAQKRDKMVQSMKMVVRFRDNTISRFESAKKGEQPVEDAKDKTIATLKEEIKVLQDQVAHNPVITKYAMENNNLRQEIKKLKAMQTVQAGFQYSREKAQNMEKLFRELSAELEGGVRASSATPSSTPASAENLPVSTLEKHKSQIKQLTAQLESSKQELAEQKEVGRKTKMELEAEVASYKKTVQELERSLEGLKVKNKMERDAMNNLHVQTIKTITTPRRKLYNLRSRLVTYDGTPMRPIAMSSVSLSNGSSNVAPGSPAGPDDGVFSDDAVVAGAMGGGVTSPEQEGIVGEEVPDHIFEQCNEALAEEVKKLQDKNSALLQHLQDKDADTLKMKQNTSKLEHQLENVNQLLESQRNELSENEEVAVKQISELTAKIEELIQSYTYAKSESEDLTVMLDSADKQLNSAKEKYNNVCSQHSKELSAVETKLLKLEMEVSKDKKEYDQLLEKQAELQEQCQTLQAENDFKVQCQEELELIIKKDKEQITLMETESKTLVERLESEIERNDFLMREQRESTDQQQQQLLTSLEANSELQKQISAMQGNIDKKSKDLENLAEKYGNSMAKSEKLEKEAKADKDAISNFMTAIRDLRSKLSESESTMEHQKSVIYDLRCQGDLLRQNLEEQLEALENLQKALVAKDEEMTRKETQHLMDKEMLQADLDDMTESNDDRMQEMMKNEIELQAMQEVVTIKDHTINEMAQKLAQKDVEMEDTISRYEAQIEDVKSNISTVVVENESQNSELQNVKLILEDKMVEIAAFKDSETRFSEFYDEYEEMRHTKTQEINNYKLELERIHNLNEALQSQFTSLQHQVENEALRFADRETELQYTCHELESQVSNLQAAFDSANKTKDDAIEQKLSVETQIAQLTANLEMADENQEHLTEELERVKALENAHFSEKEDIKSKLAEISEEKTKLIKDMDILKNKNAELSNENVKLVGHQNAKQKIQLHFQIKQENNLLKEDLNKATTELRNLKRELGHYKSADRSHLSSVSSTSSVDTPLKENVRPTLGSESS